LAFPIVDYKGRIMDNDEEIFAIVDNFEETQDEE